MRYERADTVARLIALGQQLTRLSGDLADVASCLARQPEESNVVAFRRDTWDARRARKAAA